MLKLSLYMPKAQFGSLVHPWNDAWLTSDLKLDCVQKK